MISKGVYLVIISVIIFGILNLIENLIHYNIGRSHKSNKLMLYLPNTEDFIKILITMIIFGLAQGLLTELFVQD